MNSTVKLINHASAKINVDGISIISDPWYEGSVFHKGWNLIYENEENYILFISFLFIC